MQTLVKMSWVLTTRCAWVVRSSVHDKKQWLQLIYPSNGILGTLLGIGAATCGAPIGVIPLPVATGLNPENVSGVSWTGTAGVYVEMGDCPASVVDCEDVVGLIELSEYSCLMLRGVWWMGVAIEGRFSDTLASRSGRKREAPPRRREIRLRNWLR